MRVTSLIIIHFVVLFCGETQMLFSKEREREREREREDEVAKRPKNQLINQLIKVNQLWTVVKKMKE